jgi:hypothetical protein
MVAKVDANGVMTSDGAVTPDGFDVNTTFTVDTPHPATAAAATLVPNQTLPTIGDRRRSPAPVSAHTLSSNRVGHP